MDLARYQGRQGLTTSRTLMTIQTARAIPGKARIRGLPSDDALVRPKSAMALSQRCAADMGNLFERPAEPDGEFMAAMPPCTNERHSGEV